MRCKERIPIILEHINWYDFISKSGFIDAYFKYLNCPDHLRDKNIDATKLQHVVEKCKTKINSIYSFWSQNPDQRLTQVLTNMAIIENVPGAWYYVEETEYMITSHTLKPEEILFWNTHGKDGKQKVKHILLKDMETEHIESCLKLENNHNRFYKIMDKIYYITMRKILRLRKLQKLNN